MEHAHHGLHGQMPMHAKPMVLGLERVIVSRMELKVPNVLVKVPNLLIVPQEYVKTLFVAVRLAIQTLEPKSANVHLVITWVALLKLTVDALKLTAVQNVLLGVNGEFGAHGCLNVLTTAVV